MTLKQYTAIKLVIVVAIAMIFSRSILLGNYILPLTALAIAALALFYLRSRVSDVIADERDYLAGGKAALLAIQVYSWLAIILMLVLYANRAVNPAYETIAMTLAFSTCGLMLLYALLFRYHDKVKFSNKKILYGLFALGLLIVATVVGLRLLSGEDNWICQNGEWTKHGKPTFPAPTVACE